jgi:L-Ala-D/L-Glu epimerase
MMTRKQFVKSMAGIAAAGGFMNRVPQSLLMAQEKSRVPVKSCKIRDVAIMPYNLPQKQVLMAAFSTPLTTDNVLIRLRTEEGVIGWGESSPYAPITGENQQSDVTMGRSLAELVKGRDVFALSRIIADMDGAADYNQSIKAAFEMAMWDICGKIAGLPVCVLLGGYRDSFPTDRTATLDTPSIMAGRAKGFVAAGFKVVKVKVGENPEIDLQRVREIREAVGKNIAIRIDANQGWTPADAIRSLRAMEAYNIEFCEQPVKYWDLAGMKHVRNSVGIPIMADETVHAPHDLIEVIRQEAADMVNIKLMKAGGILQAARIAQIADAANMNCMVGCMIECRLGLTAAAHVVASQKNILYADLDAFWEQTLDPIIGGMEVKDGVVRLPQTPGLGLDVDPAFVAKLRPA